MWIIADVVFDSDEAAREAERLAQESKISGVSIDLADVTSEIEILEVDDEGFPTDWLETVTSAEVLGATQVVMPAFADARIEWVDGQPLAFLAPEGTVTSDRRTISPGALVWRENAPLMFNDTSDGHDGAVHVGNLRNFRRTALVSSGVSLLPPDLGGLTKPTVSSGKIVGHGAGWGTCHTAFQNACVTAPDSPSGYAHVGEGGVRVYRHPTGDNHAPLDLDLDAAREWYDTHCELVAIAGVGDDPHGIWVNGETVLDDGEVFLSGDWRNVDGNLELISFLVVDNPGFPTARVASDAQLALTAAGIVTETDEMANKIARLEGRLAELELAAETREVLAQFEATV